MNQKNDREWPAESTEDRGERGLNLIEVVVALALLAAVLLSISGMFIQGSQSVDTGRLLTEATSLGNDILEEMDKWGYTQIYTNFGKASTDGAFSVDTKTNTFAQRWQAGIDQHLPNMSAKATIAVTPMNGSTFGAASGIRIQVTVDWSRELHARNVTVETVRF